MQNLDPLACVTHSLVDYVTFRTNGLGWIGFELHRFVLNGIGAELNRTNIHFSAIRYRYPTMCSQLPTPA